MLKTLTTTKAQTTDVEKWLGKIADLKRQCSENERETAGALAAVRDALLAGVDDGAASDRAARLEMQGRGLTLAIAEAENRLAQAREAEKAKRDEAARAADAKLGAALRAAWLAYGKSLAAELAAAQAVADANLAYQRNRQGLELSTTEASAALGQPDVAHISAAARGLAYVLPDDFGKTGLPEYTKIALKKD